MIGGLLVGTIVCVAVLPMAGCFSSLNVGAWSRHGRSEGAARTRAAPTILTQMRSGPAPGEVRNPWGRAGKPETRAARQKEQEESVVLRAK